MSASHRILVAARSALVELMSPAGRCNRKGLLVAAGLLLAAQVAQVSAVVALAVPQNDPLTIASTALIVWLSTTAVAKRLHDLSLSAWRIAWAALGVVVWSGVVGVAVVASMGVQSVAPGEAGYLATVAATMLPVLAMTLWLHLKTGVAGDNVYGPEPGADGFSRWLSQPADRNAPAPSAMGSMPLAG